LTISFASPNNKGIMVVNGKEKIMVILFPYSLI